MVEPVSHVWGARTGGGVGARGPISHVWRWLAWYSEVLCIISNGHMGIPLPLVDRQIHASENTTFPQLRWRAVIIRGKIMIPGKTFLQPVKSFTSQMVSHELCVRKPAIAVILIQSS